YGDAHGPAAARGSLPGGGVALFVWIVEEVDHVARFEEPVLRRLGGEVPMQAVGRKRGTHLAVIGAEAEQRVTLPIARGQRAEDDRGIVALVALAGDDVVRLRSVEIDNAEIRLYPVDAVGGFRVSVAVTAFGEVIPHAQLACVAQNRAIQVRT